MPELRLRWSEHEAPKSYARPFGVTFWDGNISLGGIAVSGGDLLYYRQFQTAVLQLTGELFSEPRVEAAPEAQRAWLDCLAGLLPAAPDVTVIPESIFDDSTGRIFRFRLDWPDRAWATFDAAVLLDYQEFQAALAHQSGRLYRNVAIEGIDDDTLRQRRWLAEIAAITAAPDASDALGVAWPWRPPSPR